MLSSSTSIIVMLIVITLVGLAILAIIALTRGHGRKLLNKEEYRTAWLEIENNITKDNDASYQFAILSADKLLDKALKESGVAGDTMGERLKRSGKLLQDIDKVWTAHKLRNRIAHEVGGKLNHKAAKRMLAIYKNALKDLGAI